MDSTFFIQFIALVLFAACFIHAWNTEGRRMAQQWFLCGYIYALMLTNLVVATGQLAFHPAMLVIGAAPSLTIMLYPSAYYLAYTVAKQFADPANLRAMGYLMFLLTPVLLLPLDATALQQGWWNFPTVSKSFLNGIPFYLPFAWGVAGAAFYLMVGRIRKIRLRGNGQFFAMLIAAPLLAALVLILIALVQLVTYSIDALAGDTALYVLLALLFAGLPFALVFNLPRLRSILPARRSQ